jgi:hypothetical protein
MSSKTIAFLMFAIGAAIGSVTTWQHVKKKYEQIAQEEIDSVKEVFSKKESNTDADIRTKAEQVKEKPDVVKYAERLDKHGYVNYSGGIIDDEKGERMLNKPYVISPEEFGELDWYDKIGLSYYADQILADENDELVEDVEGVVGFESLSHFGEYEDDSVFVRNDRLKCDYEILLDQRKYSDVSRRKPHQMEG